MTHIPYYMYFEVLFLFLYFLSGISTYFLSGISYANIKPISPTFHSPVSVQDTKVLKHT